MATERSDKLYEASRDAQLRFDYFTLGAIGALCAFIGHSFKPGRIGSNPSTLELAALLVLVGSAIAGFKKVERMSRLIHKNSQYLRLQEERGVLVNLHGNGGINHSTGEIYSPAQVAFRIAELERMIPAFRRECDEIGQSTLRLDAARNFLVLVGFLLLLSARVWSAYV